MSILKEKIKDFPASPGVYRFLKDDGAVLYIGKAKNLKKRIFQYFGHDKRVQLPFLMEEATEVDFTVTANELEALYLESTLIKKYLPKYNIDLRDDKNYAFLKIDYATQIPHITYVRKLEKTSNAKYFGPYSAVYKIKRTVDFIRRTFGLCGNKKIEKRPCFYYHLKKCPGVCAGDMTLEQYKEHLKSIGEFLQGDRSKLYSRLQKQMKHASKKKEFERAAHLRDTMQEFEILAEKQNAILHKKVSFDVLGVSQEDSKACVSILKIRFGKIVDTDNFVFKVPTVSNETESVRTFMERYYLETTDFPKEILTQCEDLDTAMIQKIILEKTGKKIQISCPQKGQRFELLHTALQNARLHLKRDLIASIKNEVQPKEILLGLQKLLNLPTLPLRIECYDNSNTQGTNPVGSMIVFKGGLPAKSEYRKFKFSGYEKPDDFAMMKEMLTRRLKYLTQTELDSNGRKNHTPKFFEKPDLILIDGGKGQLNAALEALQITNDTLLISNESGKMQIPIIGLAKRIEEIFLPHNSKPIVLPHENPILQLLQRLRDEAHRFGITFHRDVRSKQAITSPFDAIDGIGPVTKKKLKSKYGTLKAAKAADFEELIKLVGRHVAENIKQF